MNCAKWICPAVIGIGLPVFLEATVLSVDVADDTVAPYRSTGKVEAPGQWQGSGVVTGSVYTFFTAGHVLYDPVVGDWVSGVNWSAQGRTVGVRDFRVLASYASMVDQEGANSPKAFERDTGVGFSFEPLGTNPATISADPVADLTSAKDKLITGYSMFHARQGQAGPFSLPFEALSGAFYFVEDVTLGPGGSGGGLWAREGAHWNLAGIYVAGTDERLGDHENVAGVVALSPTSTGLLDEALAMVVPKAPVILSAPAELVIEWGKTAEIRVEFEGFPRPIATWERRLKGSTSAAHGESESGMVAKLSFRREETVPAGTEYRLTLSNTAGSVMTDWIPVTYADNQLPYFVEMPRDLVLGEGESGLIAATVEGAPPPNLQWQVQAANGDFQDEVMLAGAKTDTLVVPADNVYFADSVFRLRATNAVGTVYSDPVRLTVPIPDFGGMYTGSPSPFLAAGESFSLGADIYSGLEGARLVWRITYPHGRIVEAEMAGGFFQVSFASIEELEIGHPTVVISNDGRIQNGTILQAVVKRTRLNETSGSIEEEVALDPIVLRAEGPPRITVHPEMVSTPTSGPAVEMRYSAPLGTAVEWQIWDPHAGVWRPLSQDTAWGTELTENSARLYRIGSGMGAKLRAVVRSPGASPVISRPSEVVFPGVPPRALKTWIEDFGSDNVLDSTVVDQSLVSLIKPNTGTLYRIFELREGADGHEFHAQAIPTPSDFVPANRQLLAGGNGCLFIADNGYTGDDSHQAGSILVYRRDLVGRWQLAQRLFIPLQESAGEFPYEMVSMGDTLVATSAHYGASPGSTMPAGTHRTPHLFRSDKAGTLTFVRSILPGDAGLPETWSGNVIHPFAYEGGILLASSHQWSIPPASAPQTGIHDLIHLTWNEGAGDYDLHAMGKLKEMPDVFVAPNELWSFASWPDTGEVWHRAQLDGTRGTQSDELHDLLPGAHYLAGGDGEIVWARKAEDPVYLDASDPIQLYRLGDNDRLVGPATILPEDYDGVLPYAAGNVRFGKKDLFVVNAAAGEWRVDAVAKQQLRFRFADARILIWSKSALTETGDAWRISFRTPKNGSRLTRVYYTSSENLQDWSLLPYDAGTLLDADVDGDGLTELRQVTVPLLQGGIPVLYRLGEVEP